jgi:amino acid transporter
MDESTSRGKISMFSAAFVGIGAMVGAGIFALLGEAGAIAGTAVWLSFLIAGVISLFQGYSFAKLGRKFPSRGGMLEFFVQGFGNGHLTGSVSWLFYLVGQLITVMVALSFGSYAGALFFGEDVTPEAEKLLAIVIIICMALLNLELARGAVARVQTGIVWAVMAILGGFAFITLRNADYSLLSPDGYPGVSSIISSVAITFFAFLGFSVVAFVGPDMENPDKNLPRAMYLSLILTTTLYVAIAIGVFGMLTLDEVIAAGNTAIAAAAEPILGAAGFTIMTVAAVFSTSSAVNSQFFATTGVTAYLSEIGQFPPVLGRKTGKFGNLGTAISTIVVIVLTLMFDLSAIASIGSAVALLIFMMVGIAHLRLIGETGAKRWIVYLSIVTVVVTLLVFTFVTLVDEPATAIAMVAFIVIAVAIDRFWRGIGFLNRPATADAGISDIAPS